MCAVFPRIRKTEPSELSFSIDEQLAAQGRLIVEQDLRLTDLEKEFTSMKNKLEQLELAVVCYPEDYLTIAGYVRLKNIQISRSVAQHLSRKAKKLSEARGAEIYRTRDGLFDTVDTYRIDILDDVFAAFDV